MISESASEPLFHADTDPAKNSTTSRYHNTDRSTWIAMETNAVISLDKNPAILYIISENDLLLRSPILFE